MDPTAQVAALAQAGRIDEAVALLFSLAEQGEPMALATLADFHWIGGPVPQDPAAGRDFYRRAGEAGHKRARATYTNLLASGIFGPRDWPGALARLAAEAADNPARARTLALVEAMALDGAGDPLSTVSPRRLSAAPEVMILPGLLTAAECDYLLATAEALYQPSTIDGPGGRQVPHPLRSSDGAPLHWLVEDPAIHALNRRLAAASGTAYDQGEPLLVLRYRVGQQYHRHFDALPGMENQRVKTALVYLNTDYEGGETEFPRVGVKARGGKGDVLVFRNTTDDGRADPLSEHAGLPIRSGAKHIASRWIHARRHIP